jgi:hypothetical protein
MLIRVEVRTRQGTLLTLPLDDTASGLFIEEIEGLDPVKATLVSSSFANVDGEQHHSSRREARDLKLKVGLEEDYVTNSIRSLRNRLYSFLMPKSDVFLRFVHDDGFSADIVGTVEDFDTPIFTKEPRADISIRCFNPDFVVPVPVKEDLVTVDGSEENEGWTEINYDGTVSTGFVVELTLNRVEQALSIYNRSPGGILRQLDFSAPLAVGDKLRISTVAGSKGATLLRETVLTSVLYGVTAQSAWLEFEQGVNEFRVYATGTPAIPYTLEYLTRYGGL